MQYNLQTTLLSNLEITSNKNYKKPASWPDIRKNAENGHIYLLLDDRYPIGLTAAATGGYSIKIDGAAYADYNSGEQFSMADWSAYTDTEGYVIDYPAGASKTHIIDIYPQSTSENITAFHCSRVAASGNEQQGVLWAHFNLNNAINLTNGFAEYNRYYEPLMLAITAKNNLLKVSGIAYLNSQGTDLYFNGSNLDYCAVIDLQNNTMSGIGAFATRQTSTIRSITIKNGSINNVNSMFANARSLEKINLVNATLAASTGTGNIRTFYYCSKLKAFPKIDYTLATNMYDFAVNVESLQNTVLDVSAATDLTRIACRGTSGISMDGFKGLRVSNQAPFTGSSPQINVSYTGMDRTALVQLFNDLPTVSDGQVINITGCTGSADLTEDDKSIATNKGWDITE